jgi:hypothetical protein
MGVYLPLLLLPTFCVIVIRCSRTRCLRYMQTAADDRRKRQLRSCKHTTSIKASPSPASTQLLHFTSLSLALSFPPPALGTLPTLVPILIGRYLALVLNLPPSFHFNTPSLLPLHSTQPSLLPQQAAAFLSFHSSAVLSLASALVATPGSAVHSLCEVLHPIYLLSVDVLQLNLLSVRYFTPLPCLVRHVAAAAYFGGRGRSSRNSTRPRRRKSCAYHPC